MPIPHVLPQGRSSLMQADVHVFAGDRRRFGGTLPGAVRASCTQCVGLLGIASARLRHAQQNKWSNNSNVKREHPAQFSGSGRTNTNSIAAACQTDEGQHPDEQVDDVLQHKKRHTEQQHQPL